MTERRETGNDPGVVMLESGWSLDWGSECWGSCGLSPTPVMLMLVDTLYNSVLLSKRASGPKHYFHSIKYRITTMEKMGTRKESCLAQVSCSHMFM